MVKDYGFLLRNDPDWADKAKRVSELARDITEVMSELDLAPLAAIKRPVVAYHSACSMQHGQKLNAPPRALLSADGFDLREVPEELKARRIQIRSVNETIAPQQDNQPKQIDTGAQRAA